MRAIPLTNSSFCFVLRIPRSWYPPHRVSAQKANRFWIRNSSGAHEASIEELRTLFTLAPTAFDRVRQFRQERLTTICEGRGGRPLQGDGRLILHIVPLAAVSSLWQVDLAVIHQHMRAFPLMFISTGLSWRFNFEGFILWSEGEKNFGYTQIFRNGILEATNAPIVYEYQSIKRFNVRSSEKMIFEVIPSYLQGLQNVGVPPPLVVMITLEGVDGVICAVDNSRLYRIPPVIERSVLFLPECLIDEYGTEIDYQRVMKPAFDVLWNAAGYASAQTFSENGQWIGNQHGR